MTPNWIGIPFVTAIAACGPRDTCPTVVEPIATIAAPPPIVPPDRSPAKPPANLVFEGQVDQMSVYEDLVKDTLGVPMPDAAAVTRVILGSGVNPIIDTKRPILAAAAITLDAKHPIAAAVAFPTVTLEVVKERLARTFDLVKRVDGSFSLERKQAAETTESPTHSSSHLESCHLLPDANDGWRLICAEKEEHVLMLGPFLARGVASAKGAVRVTFHPTPLRASGWFARAFTEGISQKDFAAYEQWVNDLDQIDVAIDTLKKPRLAVTTRYRTATSPLTRNALDEALFDKPPSIFGALPSDTRAAMFTHAHLNDELIGLFGFADQKSHFNLPARDDKAIREAIGLTFGAKSTTAAWLPSNSRFGTAAFIFEGDEKKIVAAWKSSIPAFNLVANAKTTSGTIYAPAQAPSKKLLSLIKLDKPARGAPGGALHIVLSEDQSRWAASTSAPDDDVVPGFQTAAPKTSLKDILHAYAAANIPSQGHVALTIASTDEEALATLEHLRSGASLAASNGVIANLMAERSGSGGFLRLEPGSPPITFFSNANATTKTHAIQIDLPQEQIRGAMREVVKLVVGAVFSSKWTQPSPP